MPENPLASPPPQPGSLQIDARFAGPPGSANGGYAAGRLASLLPVGAAVEVTLLQPPPLETPLDLSVSGERAMLRFGGVVLAEAVVTHLTEDVVDPVPYDVAAEAMSTYAGFDQHPFPGCFACGTDRPPPDGLGLRPGGLPTGPTAWPPPGSPTPR